MISKEHYGKEQSDLLIAVFDFHRSDSTLAKRQIIKYYIVFTSNYIAHSSMFFSKCYDIALELIKTKLPFPWKKHYLLTDGSSQHFKTRNSIYHKSINAEKTDLFIDFYILTTFKNSHRMVI